MSLTNFQQQQAQKILSIYNNVDQIVKSDGDELEKAHPVGYINAHGFQKQQDGSWKWVSKKERNTSEVAEKLSVKNSSKKYKREKYKNKQLEVGDIIHRPDTGDWEYLKIISIDGDKVQTKFAEDKYGNGKWEAVGDTRTWSKKVLESHHNKKSEEILNRQEDHNELVHNISTSIGLNKVKGGNLSDKKNISELKSALEKLSKSVNNVNDSSVSSYYGGTKLSTAISGQALSVVTNDVHRGDYYSGSTPFLIQVQVGGGLDSKIKRALLDVSKKILEKFSYESNLGKSKIRDTAGTNWSSVMLTAPTDGSKYSILHSLDTLENIESK